MRGNLTTCAPSLPAAWPRMERHTGVGAHERSTGTVGGKWTVQMHFSWQKAVDDPSEAALADFSSPLAKKGEVICGFKLCPLATNSPGPAEIIKGAFTGGTRRRVGCAAARRATPGRARGRHCSACAVLYALRALSSRRCVAIATARLAHGGRRRKLGPGGSSSCVPVRAC